MPFAVAWIDLEIVILSELSQTDKTEVESQMQKNLRGTDIYTLLYTEQTTNKHLLNSTENSIRYSVMTHMGTESKKEWIYVHVQLTLLYGRN